MPELTIVGNPRRKRRGRRKLSAAQRRAGFGGKRAMSGRRSRRNPGLASLALNPRRLSRSRRSYSVSRRARRNPAMPGFLKLIDFPAAVTTGVGMVLVKTVPAMVKSKMWSGLPVSGPMGYVTKIATAALLGAVAGMVGQGKRARDLVTGGVAVTLLDAYNEFVAPKLGLSGFVTTDELEEFGFNGFVKMPLDNQPANALGRSVEIPVGALTY